MASPVAELLAELTQRGITLEPRGDSLAFHPRAKVPRELRDRLRDHKAELLRLLRGELEHNHSQIVREKESTSPAVSRTPIPDYSVVILHPLADLFESALLSLFAQSKAPTEILVCGKLSRRIRKTIRTYASRHVRQIDSPTEAKCEFVVLLDSQSLLSPGWIESATTTLVADVGAVYCDHELLTTTGRTQYPDQVTRDDLAKSGIASPTILVRRSALIEAWREGDRIDRFLKRLAQRGWPLRKHASAVLLKHSPTKTYFEQQGLQQEIVTLFIPMSGRGAIWPELQKFLDRQTWPHEQIRLILCDTSQEPMFGKTLRNWMARCNYSDVRHLKMSAGPTGLAELPRDEQLVGVNQTMCRIYNTLRENLTTDYVWVLEDDVIPPDDVLERLLQSFNENVATVSAPYRSRFDGRHLVWSRERTAPFIVTCHNYGKWLDECLQSVLFSSRRPDEVLVVDDASDDDTTAVTNRWSDWGVQYLRVEHRNVRLARLEGLNATNSEFVCFVDADDRLSPDYLRSGLQAFDRHDIGFVYSDADRFGDENSLLVQPDEITPANMSRLNHVHNGAIVRREALEMSRALEVPADPHVVHEDWLVWRRILEQGWRARKQRATYGYRRHAGGVSVAKQAERPYFDLRGLAHETITLFVALSGRTAVWPRFQQFLEQQTWPHNQVKLVLMDTSQDARFGRRIRRWISRCDYRDVRYLAEAVAEPGLADADRRLPEVQDAVRIAAARIYNQVAREVTGTFLWIVEDDVIPPNDAAELLMHGFDHTTASVAGPYPSRFHEGYVAWTEGRQIIRERGEGITQVEGNGFGCTIFRVDQFRDALFTARQQPYVDFDPAFYDRLKTTGLKAKVCWDAECEHLENDTTPIMTWDHWPEAWETTDLTDYRSEFLTGRDACQWIVETLNGPEAAAIWGLSDGDIAWWCYDALSKLPGINRQWLGKLAYTSGLHPEDRDELWPLFDEACRNSQHWLVQYGWDIAERLTHAAFLAHGVGVERDGFRYGDRLKRKVDCNAVYKLLDQDLWWPLLEGKRLAIVGGHADDFASRLMDTAFVKSTGGNEVSWSIAKQTTCPDKSVAKLPTWNRILDALFDSEWNLLLCSAGSLSAIICEHARQAGRCAIDIGALDITIPQKADEITI